MPPAALGISTAGTGGGKYVPDDIRFQTLYRLFLRPAFEVLDGSPVDPGGTTICLDLLPRLPHQALRYVKRFPVQDLTCSLVSSQASGPVARVNKP